MVAQPHDEQSEGLSIVPPSTPLTVTENALGWLWDVLHDEDGLERVANAGLALTDIHNAVKTVLTERDQLSALLAVTQATLKELEQQRDQAVREGQKAGSRAAAITRKEIAHTIGYEMLSEYSPETTEELLDALTSGNHYGVSEYTMNDLKEALERVALEIFEARVCDAGENDDDE